MTTFFFPQNLQVNPKCSLLVAKDPEDRTDLVVTLYGDAIYVCSFSLYGILVINFFMESDFNEIYCAVIFWLIWLSGFDSTEKLDKLVI